MLSRYRVYFLNSALLIFGVFLVYHLGFPKPSNAQAVFQNNNVACGTEQVLCTSSTNCNSDAESIACKNFSGVADFNGDGFVDCAAATDSIFYDSALPPDEVNVSVLINSGNTGPCPVDQFTPPPPPQDYRVFVDFISPLGETLDIGSIVVGNLNGSEFSDLALAGVQATNPNNNQISTAFSLAAGGFGPPGGFPTSQSDVEWIQADGNESFPNDEAERSLALLDCDQDGDLDAAIAYVSSSTDTFLFNVLLNDGTGLQPFDSVLFPAVTVDTLIPTDNFEFASLAAGNFGPNGPDIVYAAYAVPDGGNTESSMVICVNDGTCSFSCGPILDLELAHGGDAVEINPFSVAAGDFNDDGNTDAIISEPGLPTAQRGVHFYFGDGNGGLTGNLHVDFNDPNNSNSFTRVLTTGFFNNDFIIDAAVSVGPNTQFGNDGMVGVFTFNGTDFDITTLLFDAGDPSTAPFFRFQSGIDAADFDNQGCDDIIALAEFDDINLPDERLAFVFMNEVETLTADAGPDQAAVLNTPLVISGAGCFLNPADPNAEILIAWTLNPASGATLTNPNQINPTFTATLPGTYDLTLQCDSRCTGPSTDTMQVVVPLIPPPPPPPVVALTQGGCLTNSLTGEISGGHKAIWAILLFLPCLFLLRRLGRKGLWMAVVILTLMSLSPTANALTKSFSVNTFEPTVDDSDFFTVYSSPTMLQRNFHVGFYLDYASDPYEFGDNNFNRVSGIVDHLLTGNILGSYGILDWFTIGALIPVYFWEGIRSTNPALLLDENNLALGDVQLVFKFRLLDREKHHVGIAVVPFISFPSSTDSADFLGNGNFAGGGKVVIDGRIKDRVSIGLNVGYLVREGITDISGNVLDDQLLLSLGVSIDILKDRLKLIGEGQVATVVTDFFDRRTTPAEARVGFRYTWANNHDINAGAGFGLSNGIGSPDWRAFVGYTYTKRPVAEVAAPPPPISEVQVGDELTLNDKIYFEFDKAVIRDISKPTLDKIAGFIKAHPEITKIKIDGHTCDLGSDPYNQRLSERRARAAADYLIGQGVNPSIIGTVEGFGEKNPIVPNVDEAHREQNRRVQIFVEAVSRP